LIASQHCIHLLMVAWEPFLRLSVQLCDLAAGFRLVVVLRAIGPAAVV
jgi:hypothetical protein